MKNIFKNKSFRITFITVEILFILVIIFFFMVKTSTKNNNKSTNDNQVESKDNITISFDTAGGININSISIKKGESIELPDATKEGYKFLGWYLNNTKVSNKTKFISDSKLVAKWEKDNTKKTFTITFDSKGGSKVASKTYNCDEEITLPAAPTKEGYTFVSWVDKNDTPILDKALLTCEDITLYANFEKVKKYSCTTGTLDGDKCVITQNLKTGCTTSEVELNNKCYDPNSFEATIDCKLANGTEGILVTVGANYYCVLNEKDKSYCDDKSENYVGSKCYEYVEDTVYNDTECPSGYEYFEPNKVATKAGCYKGVAKHNYCDTGYTEENGKCVKKIDATVVNN